jgi:hypothetical protein
MVDRATTADEPPPSRPGGAALPGLVLPGSVPRSAQRALAPRILAPRILAPRILGLAAALVLARSGGAVAFPLLDAGNADQVPQGTELATPDAQDLQHQLQLANGLGPPPGGGWTIVPRIDWQEELTDNALEAHSPRQADLATFISPGISIAGDLPRMQLSFSFSPTLTMYARTSGLNSLTEQMNGLGSITLVPDLAYVDIRALSGVQSAFGGIGGLGTVGAAAAPTATAQAQIPNLAGNGQGLNRDNEVQTTSFGISPYLLRRFGDWGTGKLGYSLGVTQSDPLSGFAASPVPAGGANAQTLVSNEEIAHFATGDVMQFLQDSFDVDLQQTQGTTGTGFVNSVNGVPQQTTQTTSSTRDTVSNQVTYQLTRGISVSAMGGHEDIVYSGFGAQSIHDLIWSLGTTWVPNPDSSLAISYGHQNGFNSLTVNGYYAVTARTQLTVSYGSMLGTQLELVQNQLNLAAASPNGTLVNGQTGGSLFGATNALALQDGVFRTTTLSVGSQTSLDRDIFSASLLLATQTSSGASNGFSSQAKTVAVNWLHQMRPDMTVSAAISYAIQDQGAGAISAFNPGNNTSIAATLAWQWQISDTVSTSLRYSFFERSSPDTAFDMYQNILILGIAKTF